MSQENVELVRRFYEHFNRNGVPDFDRLDPEIVWSQPDEIAGGKGTYRGHEGVRRALTEIRATFDEFRSVPNEFIAAGEDCVVVLGRDTAVGRLSGAPIDQPVGHVWRLRDGKAIEWRVYLDPSEALEAAGLSDQDAHADP
jgi:uncharacterized protein